MALLRLPLPSLLHLFVRFERAPLFQHSLEPFPNFSPNVERLHIQMDHSEDTLSKIEPNYITRWQNLCSVTCYKVILDMADLVHLSRMPALTDLEFALGATLPTPTSLLAFPKLRFFTLHAESLAPISQLLCQVELPTLTSFSAKIVNCPSDQDLASFFTGIPTSNPGHTMESLQLDQSRHHVGDVPRSNLSLDFEDLRPCMALGNLKMELDIACNVNLTDRQILTLASAWPKLKRLVINQEWSWNMSGGITPGGLVQLLGMYQSLTSLALRLDTRGYTEVPPSHAFASLGWTFPPEISIDVLDSAIQAESVSAVATFFCGLTICYKSYFEFIGWNTPVMDVPNEDDYGERWDEVICITTANLA